jgi:hypothetical protein
MAEAIEFSTYALYWIRAFVGAATAKLLGAMNLPTSRAEQLRTAHGLEAELSQSLGRPPTLRELADALDRSEDGQPGCFAPAARSLELVDGAALERLHTRDELEAVLMEPVQVRELLLRLDDLDRRVLELRLGFADGKRQAYADTARVLEISVTRVRRIEARALERLEGFVRSRRRINSDAAMLPSTMATWVTTRVVGQLGGRAAVDCPTRSTTRGDHRSQRNLADPLESWHGPRLRPDSVSPALPPSRTATTSLATSSVGMRSSAAAGMPSHGGSAGCATPTRDKRLRGIA